MAWKGRFGAMNAYDVHKFFINEYLLTRPGSTSLIKRDSSKDKRDIDVIRENHRFLWNDDAPVDTWEEKLARKYYDKLFKEYCIGDLSKYKEDKFGFRWRTEKEVISGKGQFSCGGVHCQKNEHLRTWEVNFSYVEHGEKKSALVKLRLCEKCSRKLNYRFKRKEVKRLVASKKPPVTAVQDGAKVVSKSDGRNADASTSTATAVWRSDGATENNKDQPDEQDIDQFLQDLFL